MQQFIQTIVVKVAIAMAILSNTCMATLGREVRSNYLPGTNFTQYHTYKWVTPQDGLDQIVDAQSSRPLTHSAGSKRPEQDGE